MTIVHLSYAPVVPPVSDPHEWLDRISFLTGVMEAMTDRAKILGVFHIDFQGIVEKNGVTYHFTGYQQRQLTWPTTLHRLVAGLHPDVVIVHGLIFPLQILMLRYAIGRGVKIFCQHHAERPFKDLRSALQRLADREIQGYFFSSFEQGNEWIAKGQIKVSKKVHEIMGTSSPFKSNNKQIARDITKVTGDPVYVWVGALDANKDPFTLVHAFMKFLVNVPGASLYLIYQQAAMESDIRAMIGSDTSGKRIHLVGPVKRKDMSNWLNSADFIVSTSHNEGSGIAVCEGMSCGCIPLLTDIPSFRMMTGNGSVGLLFEPGNAAALHEVLMRSKTLNIDAGKTKTLQRFESELSFHANAKKIFKVINNDG